MLKFFTSLLGEDFEILKTETPQSKKKILLMGSILFVPVTMWFFQGYFLSSIILGQGVLLSALVGIICAALIFIIERSIIMIPSASRWVKLLRYSIGFIIAAIGSIILDEVLFHNDINNHMANYQEVKLQQDLEPIDNEYELPLERRRLKMENLKSAWDVSLRDATSEADGTSGSGNTGVGKIALMKLEAANKKEAAYEQAKAEYDTMFADYTKKRSEAEKRINEAFDSNSLLTRLKVLFNFIATDIAMLLVWLLFTGLLFLMEFMVVIVKSSYPETSYEVRVKSQELLHKNRYEKILQRELKLYNPALEGPVAQQAQDLVNQQSQYLN